MTERPPCSEGGCADGALDGESHHHGEVLDVSSFQCSICYDLLDSPVVGECGGPVRVWGMGRAGGGGNHFRATARAAARTEVTQRR
jgi:hypothetical protein